MSEEWPLVGRGTELRQLHRLLITEHKSAVLAGPAGVGKTRLAREALKLAEQAGLATARVTATRAAAGLPFGALAPLLPAVEHRGAGTPDDRTELLRRSTAALLEQAAGRHLIVLVDDAHLLDEASATLVHQLAGSERASVVASVRTEETAPEFIVSLWKDGLAERLDVQGLTTEAIEQLLASVLVGPVDPAAATHLAVRCQGNVLFLRELVLGALDTGVLRREGGIWRLSGALAPSRRLIELVESRLDGLTAAERGVLGVVSYGEPLGTAELMSLDPGLALNLEQKGLLASRRAGRRLEVRLAHPLYGDVLRARLSALRVPIIAESLAEVVEPRGLRRREDHLRVATWRLDAGGGSPELLIAAASEARWRYDFALAERLAQAASDAGAGFDAALLAAEAAALQGRVADAEAQFAALAEQATDDRRRVLVAVNRVDQAIFLGQHDAGLRIAEDAEAKITDQECRDELAARRAELLLALHGPSVAAAAAAPLLDRPAGPGFVWACIVGGYSLSRLGRLDAAVEAATQGYAAHQALTRPLQWYPWMHLFVKCEALAYAGRLEEEEQLALAEYQRGVDEGSIEAQAWFAWQLAIPVGDRGDVRTAARRAREAVTLFEQLGRPQLARLCSMPLALALALAGKAREASSVLAALEGPGVLLEFAADLPHVRAWTAVAHGDIPKAHRLLTEAVEVAQNGGDRVGEAVALHSRARLGEAAQVVDRLSVLATEIDGDLVASRALHARALAARDPDGLERAATSFEAMGALLLAAEAAADAAVIGRAAGTPRQVAAAEHRAGLLAGQCEGATTPALRAIETRAQLTDGERAAAVLAAAGRSNREIADELVLSVRTVEGRLQRVYDKLGVSSRSELAAALGLSPREGNGKAPDAGR